MDTDDGSSHLWTPDTLLEVLRQHATNDGKVDVVTVVSAGVDLRRVRPTLEQLCRRGQLLLEFNADRIDRITLLSTARRETSGLNHQP